MIKWDRGSDKMTPPLIKVIRWRWGPFITLIRLNPALSQKDAPQASTNSKHDAMHQMKILKISDGGRAVQLGIGTTTTQISELGGTRHLVLPTYTSCDNALEPSLRCTTQRPASHLWRTFLTSGDEAAGIQYRRSDLVPRAYRVCTSEYSTLVRQSTPFFI